MDEVTNIMLERIKEIDQRDENQILAELAGETINDYVYEVTVGKKRTVKLSWAGTREMARAKGNIALEEPVITDADGYIRVIVRGTDLTRNFSVFGGCHQPKQQKVKVFDAVGKEAGHQVQDDPYYFTKALSKAQRNVLQSVIPADYIAKAIDKFLIAAGKPALKQLAPPKQQKPRTNTGVPKPTEFNTLQELELYAYNRWHLQPADMYRELGYAKRADVNESPWECFLKLKGSLES